MTKQQHDRCFEDLIEQIILGQLVIVAGHNLFPRKAVLYCSGHIDLAANNGNRLGTADIFAVEPLFQQPADAFCENRRKQIVDMVKGFLFDVLIPALIERGERIRKHIVDVFDEDAFILHD